MKNIYKKCIVRLIQIVGIVMILVSICACGGGGGDDGVDSSVDNEPVAQDLSCVEMAALLGDQEFSRPPVEDMDMVTGWEGYVFHHTHVHNEGVGKWYLYSDESIAIKAPANGRICWGVEDNEIAIIDGKEVVMDSGFDLFFGNDRRIGYGHIWVLKSIKDAFDAAGEEGLVINEGDLIGYTSPGGSALDFQIIDENESNGLPEVATHVKHFMCPMNYYAESSALKDALLSKWNELTYFPALNYNLDAEDDGVRGQRGNAELAYDTCSAMNVNTMNHGTIWGNWYNTHGAEDTGSVIGSWYHYARGTVTLLSNEQLNPETYTVGFDGEDGLWSEMQSNTGVGSPWVNTDQAASIWLPDGVLASDEQGCFILSLYSIDHEDALWIYFELAKSEDGNDELRLTRTEAYDLEACLDQGEAIDAEEVFNRY